MQNLLLEATGKTPYINFNALNGNFEIKGRLIPENPHAFNQPIIDWLLEFEKELSVAVTVIIHLEYFNTSSAGAFLVRFFRFLEKLSHSGSLVSIHWLYEDEDMRDQGRNFARMIKLPFEVIAIEAE